MGLFKGSTSSFHDMLSKDDIIVKRGSICKAGSRILERGKHSHHPKLL